MTVLTDRTPPPAREPFEIRVLRHFLRNWPLDRGKGFFLDLSRPMWQANGLAVEIEPDVLVRARFDDYVFRWAFANGFHRQPEIQLSRRLINAGDTVVDAGANIGLWAMGAARRAGRDGAVHAFEPVPDNFEELRSNIELNALAQVHAVQCGLSDRKGRATIYAATNGNSGMASLAQSAGVDCALDIELTTLDDYCEAKKIVRVDFLKMDVEGAELAVLEGGRELLKKEPMILFEVSEQTARPFGRSTTEVKAYLSEMGFQSFRVCRRRLERVEVNELHEYNEDLLALTPAHLGSNDVLGRLIGGV